MTNKVLLNLYASATVPFEIDDDLATQRVSILGRTGTGKTYTAAVLVEELLRIHTQVIVVDPLDVWWGIRSSADGKRDGFSVVIFGGDHADIPLREEDAKAVADAIVDHGFSCVLSISHLSMNGQRRFMTDFAERLFHRKHETQKRTPVHIAIDEADAFAPQKPQPGEQRMLGAIQALVRRGRSRGIGTTLISQRPAVVSKDVLTQTEVMIAHQLTGPHDKKAVQAWVEAHDEGKRGTEFMRSIIELERGEAWLWSPTWLKAFTRIKVRKRTTFDSSFTPSAFRYRCRRRGDHEHRTVAHGHGACRGVAAETREGVAVSARHVAQCVSEGAHKTANIGRVRDAVSGYGQLYARRARRTAQA